MKLQDLIILATKAITDIGMSTTDAEIEGGYATIRIKALNGKVVGALTVPPQWLSMDEAAVIPVIKAHALEACIAATKEPSHRG